MSKLFLDCGSNLGQGYEFFSSIYGSDCTYHLFEPNIKCYNILVEKYSNKPNIQIYNNAVYNSVGTLNFRTASDFDVGGSLIEEHNSNYLKDEYFNIPVSCINLIDHINEHYDLGNKIYLKLDIESSEYDVLESMIESGTIHKVSKIYCEFHSQYMDAVNQEVYLQREKNIINYVIENNINFELWH